MLRCYSIYQLVKGITSVDEVNANIKPKLTLFVILSIIYDLPRMYLNVNLFGALCSFYYMFIEQVMDVSTLYHVEGKYHIDGRNEQNLSLNQNSKHERGSYTVKLTCTSSLEKMA